MLAQGEDIVPLPRTKRRKYLEENVGALHASLTAAALERIDRELLVGVAAGERYVAQAMRAVNQ